MTTPVFKRILLKLSGEALAANQGFGVDPLRIHEIAAELADVHSLRDCGRGRKFLPRCGWASAGNGPCLRRSHGYAGYRD